MLRRCFTHLCVLLLVLACSIQPLHAKEESPAINNKKVAKFCNEARKEKLIAKARKYWADLLEKIQARVDWNVNHKRERADARIAELKEAALKDPDNADRYEKKIQKIIAAFFSYFKRITGAKNKFLRKRHSGLVKRFNLAAEKLQKKCNRVGGEIDKPSAPLPAEDAIPLFETEYSGPPVGGTYAGPGDTVPPQ